MTNQRNTRKKRGARKAPTEQMSFSDANISAESTPRKPRRRFSDWAKLFFGLVLTASLGLMIAYGAYHYAKSTPRFNIVNVEVEGAHRLLEADILGVAKVKVGDNIFKLVPEDGEKRLAAHPWISHVRISRRLPGQIKIVVEEREAAALLELSRQLFLVDIDGSPFKAWSAGDPSDLPIITGLSADKLKANRKVEVGRILAALELLRDYALTQQAKADAAQEVHLDRLGHATLIVGEQGVALRLGAAPWKSKLLRAAKVLRKANRAGGQSETIFLDNSSHPERVVVRLR